MGVMLLEGEHCVCCQFEHSSGWTGGDFPDGETCVHCCSYYVTTQRNHF